MWIEGPTSQAGKGMVRLNGVAPDAKIFIQDNKAQEKEGWFIDLEDNWALTAEFKDGEVLQPATPTLRSERPLFEPIPVYDDTRYILDHVGATLPRDAEDHRIINEVRSRTGYPGYKDEWTNPPE